MSSVSGTFSKFQFFQIIVVNSSTYTCIKASADYFLNLPFQEFSADRPAVYNPPPKSSSSRPRTLSSLFSFTKRKEEDDFKVSSELRRLPVLPPLDNTLKDLPPLAPNPNTTTSTVYTVHLPSKENSTLPGVVND